MNKTGIKEMIPEIHTCKKTISCQVIHKSPIKNSSLVFFVKLQISHKSFCFNVCNTRLADKQVILMIFRTITYQ